MEKARDFLPFGIGANSKPADPKTTDAKTAGFTGPTDITAPTGSPTGAPAIGSPVVIISELFIHSASRHCTSLHTTPIFPTVNDQRLPLNNSTSASGENSHEILSCGFSDFSSDADHDSDSEISAKHTEHAAHGELVDTHPGSDPRLAGGFIPPLGFDVNVSSPPNQIPSSENRDSDIASLKSATSDEVLVYGETLDKAVSGEPRSRDLIPMVYGDPAELWNKTIEDLRSRFDRQIFVAWLQPLEIQSWSFEGIRSLPSEGPDLGKKRVDIALLAPNKFCADHVQKNYSSTISDAVKRLFEQDHVTLEFRAKVVTKARGVRATYSSEMPANSSNTGAPATFHLKTSVPSSSRSTAAGSASETSGDHGAAHTSRKNQISRPTSLNPKYNFSNFVVGTCNQFAHAVSLRVAESPGSNYNPLFLYGGVGLGKTHLVNAIGNASVRRGRSVLMVSSEVFVTELIGALRSDRMQQFRNKFRSIDVLIIDDIQFLIGKERTQEEFFHTFNELYQSQKQIVITSDKVPQELIGLEERLRTRFACGLSADVQAPDFETRVAILIKKTEAQGVNLPLDAARLLAECIDTNVRELEGALNRLQALSALYNTPINVELTEEVLQSIAPERNREVTTELIQKVVAEKYNVSVMDLIGKRRTQNIAFARQVAMYLCRRLTGKSYPEIGALFGGRDHSTVIHAFRNIEEQCSSDMHVQSEVATVEKGLKRSR